MKSALLKLWVSLILLRRQRYGVRGVSGAVVPRGVTQAFLPVELNEGADVAVTDRNVCLTAENIEAHRFRWLHVFMHSNV